VKCHLKLHIDITLHYITIRIPRAAALVYVTTGIINVDEVGSQAAAQLLTTHAIGPILDLQQGGSVAEWLACWTRAQKAWVKIAVATLSSNSLRQTAHTHCASVHQAAKLVAALLRVAGITAGLAESNGSLPPGL